MTVEANPRESGLVLRTCGYATAVRPADGSLDPAGPIAEAIADLWWLMLGLGVAVFALFVGLLVAGLFHRARNDEDAGRPPGRHLLWILGGGVVLPLVVIVVVWVATVQVMRFTPDRAESGALVIDVIGHQWWWEVHYPDADVTMRNELHIPTGRPVEFRLTTADVIHSFWIPPLGGKMDMIPGDVNTLVLVAEEPGEYLTQCYEFCGLEHAQMFLTVVAEPVEDFEEWLGDKQDAS